MLSKDNRRADTAGFSASILSLLLLIPLTLSAPARGDDPDPYAVALDTETGTDADTPALPVGPVTVTATRAEREVLDVPGNVTVLDREDIDRSGARTIPELLRRQAGIFVTNTTTNPAGTTIEARGFSPGQSAGSSILVQVDGRRVNEADSGVTDWALLPLDQVESIEIVRGPASALYGNNAVGGVIHIRTRPAPGSNFLAFRGRAGRYDSGGGSFKGAASLGPVTGSFFIDGYTTDGYRDGADFENQTYKGTLQMTLFDRLVVGATGRVYHDERELPGTLTGMEIDLFSRRAQDPSSERDQSEVEGHSIDAFVEALLAEDIELVVRPYASYRNDDVIASLSCCGEFSIDTDKNSVGVDTQLRIDLPVFGLTNRLILGGQFLHEETDRIIVSGLGTTFSRNESDTWALFAQEELNLLPNLLLAAGVRWDKVRLELFAKDDDEQDTATPRFSVVSPKASITWRFLPTVSAYAAYARGFRVPNFDEDAPLLFTDVLPNIDKQISDSGEIGIKLASERAQANLALYWMSVRNEIVFNPFTFENVAFDRVRHRGIELSGSVQVLEWLTLYGSYTFEDVVVKSADPIPNCGIGFNPDCVELDGRRLPMTPKHRGTAGLLAHLPMDLEFGMNVNAVGHRILSNDFDRQLPKLDPYATLDLLFAYRPEFTEHLRGALTFMLRNVTGTRYQDFGARSDVFDPDTFESVPTAFFYPAPRRTWEVGLMLTFTR